MLHDAIRIKEAREGANVSQADAAKTAHIPRSKLSAAEGGGVILTAYEIMALERAILFLSQSRAYKAAERLALEVPA